VVRKFFIDVGASTKEDVEKMGIQVGTVITFKDNFMKLGEDYIIITY
jgi:putative aminopeptidase FrvX